MSESLWNDETIKPIQHIRVVDLSVMLTGPFLTRILAQYGAEVIKVERGPEGDPFRTEHSEAVFELLNRGKKSICTDFDKVEGREIVKSLASEADVFVENFPAGMMDSLGLGYGDLAEKNPDLIYLSLRGMSEKSGGKAGQDLNFISTSGVGQWFLEGGVNYSAPFADVIGGVYLPLTKLLIHLANPNRRGMHLISHIDEGFRSLYLPKAYEAVEREELKEEDKKSFNFSTKISGHFPNSRFYQCRDRQWISLQAIQKKHWERFCEIADKKDWLERGEDTSLIPEVEKMFLEAPATYWESLSANADTCLFRVVPWEEFLKFPYCRNKLSSDPLAWVGLAQNEDLSPVPALGQDSFSIMHGLGYSNEKISQLLASSSVIQKKDF